MPTDRDWEVIGKPGEPAQKSEIERISRKHSSPSKRPYEVEIKM